MGSCVCACRKHRTAVKLNFAGGGIELSVRIDNTDVSEISLSQPPLTNSSRMSLMSHDFGNTPSIFFSYPFGNFLTRKTRALVFGKPRVNREPVRGPGVTHSRAG